MNLYLRELKANRKSLIIWCVGIIFLVYAGMLKYAGLSSSGQGLNKLMGEMPKSLQAIMGAGAFDLTKASGYYGVLFLYLLVMATIQATLLGANIISKEERDKTFEFLFVKPISRSKIIVTKLLAALSMIFIFNLATLITSIFAVQYYGDGEKVASDIVQLMVGMYILQVLFLLIGSALSAVLKRSKIAASLSSGILFLTFLLSIAIDLNEKFDTLKYVTPFKYFEAKNLMYDGGFDAVYVILSLVLILVLFSITFIFYQKKDLNV